MTGSNLFYGRFVKRFSWKIRARVTERERESLKKPLEWGWKWAAEAKGELQRAWRAPRAGKQPSSLTSTPRKGPGPRNAKSGAAGTAGLESERPRDTPPVGEL